MLTDVPLTDAPGRSFLLYGDLGIGKTSSINTIPGFTLIINFESRNPAEHLTKKDVAVMAGRHFHDLKEWLHQADNELRKTGKLMKNGKQVKNIFLDSLHTLQTAVHNDLMAGRKEQTRFEIEEDIAKKKDRIVQRVDPNNLIASEYSMEMQEWGASANKMTEVVIMLCKFAEFNINVFVTCLSTVSPSYAPTYDHAPAIEGKKYGEKAGSHFTGVCHVVKRICGKKSAEDGLGKEGDVLYPPYAVWVSPDNRALVKCPVAGFPKMTTLNWKSILEAITKLKEESKGG